jgi:hypothetical protein
MNEQKLIKISAISAMLGVVIAIVSAMMGPRDLNFENIHQVLQTFKTNKELLKIHGLGVSLGALLILGGFIGLRWSLNNEAASPWARLGLAVAVVKTVIHLTGAMMGGSVIASFAEAYFIHGATSEALWVGRGLYIFYEALLAPTFLTLAACILLFGIAVLKSKRYPVWLGWVAFIPGIWTGIGWIVFVMTGPIDVSHVMMAFIPGFMLSMIWLFITGIFMLRPAQSSTQRSSVIVD